MIRRHAAALLVALSMALVGCTSVTGGSASPEGASGAGGGGSGGGAGGRCGSEPGLCTTIEVTGAVSVQGTFLTGMGGGFTESCAEYIKGESGRLQLPTTISEPVGGHEVSLYNLISRYTGPGSYDAAAIGAVDGGEHVDVDRVQYISSERSTSSATVNPDGSGSFTFGGFAEASNSGDTSPRDTISGTYTWTCQGS